MTAGTIYDKKTPKGESMAVTDEVAVDRDAADEVAVVMEDALDVLNTALALGDDQRSVRPLITPGGPKWSWCGQQPPDSRCLCAPSEGWEPGQHCAHRSRQHQLCARRWSQS